VHVRDTTRGKTLRESDQPVICTASTGTERAVDQSGLLVARLPVSQTRGADSGSDAACHGMFAAVQHSRPWRSQKLMAEKRSPLPYRSVLPEFAYGLV